MPNYLIKDELFKVAKDILANFSVPGLPESYVTFISKNVQVISGVKGLETCVSSKEIENSINSNLSPMVLLWGVAAPGINRGTFNLSSFYVTPEIVMQNNNEDYEVDKEVLNYVYSIISGVNHLKDLEEEEIVMITYYGEDGISSLEKFKNLTELKNTIYEEYGIEKN